MGAWGVGTFENDDAGDWVYDLEESNDFSLLISTFAQAKADYLEAPEGSNILAAAEVVLALSGSPRDGLPQAVAAWVKNNKGDVSELRKDAAEAVAAVLSDKSELKELWEDDEEEWTQDVKQLHLQLIGET